MNPIKMWNKLSLFTKIMIGFVLGIGAGLVLGESATKLAFLGTILTRLLTMVVAPLVLGVDDKLADFVIPFGAVMNMNSTAIYEAVAVIFAS